MEEISTSPHKKIYHCGECGHETEDLYLDELSIQEIKALIANGSFTEQDVIDHYGNEWWDFEE